MPLDLVTLPCLSDNYAFVLHDQGSGATAVVDVPEAAPILELLNARGWQLGQIVLTHHHWDHVDGVADLVAATGAKVIGAAADAHRLPALDQQVSGGDSVEICGEAAQVLDVSGHTVGHVAYHLPGSKLLFTGDSLMALGCGRLFEGDPAMMWRSLSKLAALPGHSIVCSGHEYTQANAKFALTIEPGNAALISRNAEIAETRAAGRFTVPSLLSQELETNPFMRPHSPEIRANLGLEQADNAEVFAEIRRRKDNF